jgi:metal-sulfur cluster biosynthetic enzyme
MHWAGSKVLFKVIINTLMTGEYNPQEHFENSRACKYPDFDKYSYEDIEDCGAKYGEDTEGLEKEVWESLYKVQDPEMPISIVDLGLIYSVNINNHKEVEVEMTFKRNTKDSIVENTDLDSVKIKIVHNPEWNLSMVSERGQELLKDFGISV